MAVMIVSCPSPMFGKDMDGFTMQLRPNRSNATNGDTVFVICKITNNSGAQVNDATLTVTFPKELKPSKVNTRVKDFQHTGLFPDKRS